MVNSIISEMWFAFNPAFLGSPLELSIDITGIEFRWAIRLQNLLINSDPSVMG